MRLGRLVPVQMFEINAPKWNGKANRREVGLALPRIEKHNVIEFTYVRKSDGMKSIPGQFYFDGDKIRTHDYEYQNIKGLTLVIVPFSDLEPFERGDE